MKKALITVSAIIICIILILSNISLLDIPRSIDYRVDEIRTAWLRDVGPVVNGTDIDYSYYSPVKNGASAEKKYPLIIIMAGALEGLQEGFELVANSLAAWSAEEYQSCFKDGGTYLFIARAPEEDWTYWDSSELTPSLKAAIDDFCIKNPNIDTNRIHIIGWCLGGNGAINLASSYPNEFASTTIMCPNRAITGSEAESMKNMPVWFFGSETDSYSNYKRTILKSYELLSETSNRKSDLRLTSYSSAPDVTLLDSIPFISNHNLWDNFVTDLQINETDYPDMKTIDGNGNTVVNPSAISWIDSFDITDGRETSKAADTSAFSYKAQKFFHETIKGGINSCFMRFTLNIFSILGWI
ncbi:MAG: dienelactone hydrolase family protein [Clostridia bacterium]|nr:dienelactone hydrolase family protein [Clostridia bacterium]